MISWYSLRISINNGEWRILNIAKYNGYYETIENNFFRVNINKFLIVSNSFLKAKCIRNKLNYLTYFDRKRGIRFFLQKTPKAPKQLPRKIFLKRLILIFLLHCFKNGTTLIKWIVTVSQYIDGTFKRRRQKTKRKCIFWKAQYPYFSKIIQLLEILFYLDVFFLFVVFNILNRFTEVGLEFVKKYSTKYCVEIFDAIFDFQIFCISDFLHWATWMSFDEYSVWILINTWATP